MVRLARPLHEINEARFVKPEDDAVAGDQHRPADELRIVSHQGERFAF